jgi:hypothetical protein
MDDAAGADGHLRVERSGRVGRLVVGHVAEREHPDRLAFSKPVSLAISPAATVPL